MTDLAPSLTERQVITPAKGESAIGKADKRGVSREKAAATIALVKALGGASAVAAQIGSSRSAVTNWYTSGIPAKFWLPLSELATARGVDPDVARLALPRVAAGSADQQWAPAPRLAAVIEAVETAATLPDLMSCLIELDRLNDPDPTRAPYPLEEDNDWTDRWVLAEAKVLERIAGLRPETADQAQTLFKLMAARIEDDVVERDDVNQYIWSALMTAHECLWSPATAALADTDLIRTCHLHPAYIKAYNLHGGDLELEKDPLWKAYEQSRDAISDFEPKSIAGMLAKAHAAKAEAANKDGTENPDGTMAATWSWDLVNDLLRLFGTPEEVSETNSAPEPRPLSIEVMVQALCDMWREKERAEDLARNIETIGRRDEQQAEIALRARMANSMIFDRILATEQLVRTTPPTNMLECVQQLMLIGSEMGCLLGSEPQKETPDKLEALLAQFANATAAIKNIAGLRFSDPELVDNYAFGGAADWDGKGLIL